LVLSTNDPLGELWDYGARTGEEAVSAGKEVGKSMITNVVFGAFGTPANIGRMLGLW